jgi:type I restriction enzyme S subunit
MITSRYPLVSFNEIFKRLDQHILLDEFQEYACVGVRLEGRGGYVRESKIGGQIKRKKQWVVRHGDVMYNKLFAWRGAFAVADDELDGCIASDKFPLYKLDCSRVLPRYLEHWFRTPQLAFQARQWSKGAAALSKLTLNPPDFWKLTLPLPDIKEQEKIAAALDSMLGAVQEALALRQPIDAVVQGRRAGIGSEVRLMMTAALDGLNSRVGNDPGILDDTLTLRPRSGPSFPVSEDGPGEIVIMPSALGGYRYDPAKCMRGDGSESVGKKDLVQVGDLLISRGNKRDQVGLCIVYREIERHTYANLLMRMQVKDAFIPEFVKYWIMSPLAVRYIRNHTKGTSPSVQKINQRALINMPFPKTVSIEEQMQWIAYLDGVFERVERIEELIREQHDDLESMYTSLLTAAFKGEL